MVTFPDGEEVLLARSEGRLGPLVEHILAELVGVPWETLHRAADMPIFGFGDFVTLPPRTHRPDLSAEENERRDRRWAKPVARFRLHIQCPMRIDGPNGPFLGAQDVYRAADPPHKWLPDDDQRFKYGTSLFDRRCAELDARTPDVQLVTAVTADSGGGFVLEISGGWRISVAPSSASVREFWRYFHTDVVPHFVLFNEN